MIIVLQIESTVGCTNFEYILDKIMCHLVKIGVHSILKVTHYFNYVFLLEKKTYYFRMKNTKVNYATLIRRKSKTKQIKHCIRR